MGTLRTAAKPLLLAALLFSSEILFPDQTGAQPQPADQAAAPGSFQLIGTLEGPDLSGAVLQDAAGVQAFYRLREQLPDGSQIVKIRSDSILLKQTDGTLHEVFITQDNKKALQAPPPAVSIPPRQVENVPDPGRGRQTPSRKRRSRTSDEE